jgi:quinol monooxygenase YgiN
MKRRNHATCVVRLTVSAGASSRQTRDFLAALRYISTATRLEDGCLGCSVWTGPEPSLHYVAEWATENDLRRWVRSDRFTSLLSLLESAPEPPQVRFDFVSETRGLDYVAAIRQDDAD